MDEKHPLEPIDFNGISKMARGWDEILHHQVYGMQTTSLRLTNVYGPRMWIKDGRLSFIGLWFRQMVEGQELLVTENRFAISTMSKMWWMRFCSQRQPHVLPGSVDKY